MKRPNIFQLVWVSEYRPNSAEKKLIVVAPEDEKRFAEFLRQPDTGLFRLIPFKKQIGVVSVRELETGTTPRFNMHACMYSFSKKKHGHGLQGWVEPQRLGWAELSLQDGYVVSGFMGESLGLMVELGDSPLESLSVQSAGVANLDSLAPPVTYREAFGLRKRLAEGYEINKTIYRSSLPAVANTTYALRAIGNKRADVLIGFRIIRQDENGSLTILWKKLKRYSKPSWKRSPKK